MMTQPSERDPSSGERPSFEESDRNAYGLMTPPSQPTVETKPTEFIRYWAGADGRIYSDYKWRGRYGRYPIAPISNGRGYLKVRVTTAKGRRNIPIHRLIAQAWIGPRPTPDYEVRHLDGDRYNNVPSNLAWGTRQDNADDREKHGSTARGAVLSEIVRRGLSQRARLIAAAPEMLRVLKLLTNDTQSTMKMAAAIESARALLARISGKETP